MLLAAEVENATYRSRAEPAAIWKARKYIEEHSGEELSLTKVAKVVNMRLMLKYGYFNYRDVTSGGHNNYQAHSLFSSLQIRF